MHILSINFGHLLIVHNVRKQVEKFGNIWHGLYVHHLGVPSARDDTIILAAVGIFQQKSLLIEIENIAY